MKVVFLQELLPSYRVEFLRQLGRKVDLTVIYGGADGRADGFDVPDHATLPDEATWIMLESRRASLGGKSVTWLSGLTERIAAIRPDVVIAVGNKHLIQNHLLIAARRRRGYRLYFIQHARHYTARAKILDRAEQFYHREYLCRFSDGLILYTAAERHELVQEGFSEAKVSYCQNTLDTARIQRTVRDLSPEEIAGTCAEYGVAERPSMAVIGRLVAGKNVDQAIDYHETLQRRVPELQTVIIGDGPQRAALEARAGGVRGVRCTGRIFDPRVFACLLRRCRFVLSPGYVGLNVVHAFAHAKPFVAFRSLENKPEVSYLSHGHNGLLLDRERLAENEDVLARLLTDEPWLAELSRGAAATAQALTVEHMADLVYATLMRTA